MPKPIGRGQRYVPGIDGLRAVAVSAVVLYHLDAPWLAGGLLGVGIFFTLSGYLITDLLLQQHRATGSLGLQTFWLRRARRLLPALFVMLAVVVLWVAVGDRVQLGAVRTAALSAVVYVNNWWQIAQHVPYFARFGPPNPLGNLWSLAVEEQFYLVWPWLVLAGVWWVQRRRGAWGGGASERAGRLTRHVDRRGWLLLFTLLLAGASAVEMAVLFHPSFDPTRVYEGTDTRAFELLCGAALAMVWPSGSPPPLRTRRAVLLLDGAGVAGAVTIALMLWRMSEYDAFLYRGGLVLLTAATVAVLVSVTHPAGHLGRILGWEPLRAIGVVSYGIYLWHYPIIVLTTPASAHAFDLPRAALQVAATVAVAAASWHFIESPVRNGALGRLWHRAVVRLRRATPPPSATWAAATGVALAVATASAAVAGALPAFPAGTLAAGSTSPTTDAVTGTAVHAVHQVAARGHGDSPAGVDPARGAGAAPGAGPAALPTSTSAAPRTSCTAVAHIGDSTSESLVSDAYLPTDEQLPAQYARVGVQTVALEIVGATSIVETLPGDQNGYELAQGLLAQGFHGCWVIALGTNDAADIAVGSNVGAAQRIQRMMDLIGDQPVLWVNTITLQQSGPYAESNMAAWDQALVHACPAYPTMRVYDWAAVAQPSWFIADGIHYTSTGSAARAADIANALAAAFPAPVPTSGTPERHAVTARHDPLRHPERGRYHRHHHRSATTATNCVVS